MTDKSPLVSVCCIAYRHAKYISMAIDGMLMQETNFAFEIVISDDCSCDGTQEILNDYALRYPEKIRLLHKDKNVGMMKNFITTLSACKGKYIAVCEGDDYWTDPLKLQKQADHISTYPGCELVFTDLKVYNEEDDKFHPNWATIVKENYSFSDLAESNRITTCTILFKKPVTGQLENYLAHFKIGDWPLYLLLLQNGGYACFLKDSTAVYRMHTAGNFSSKGAVHMIDSNIDVLETAITIFSAKEQLYSLKKSLVRWYYAKMINLSRSANAPETRSYIKNTLKPGFMFYAPGYFFKSILLYILPGAKQQSSL